VTVYPVDATTQTSVMARTADALTTIPHVTLRLYTRPVTYGAAVAGSCAADDNYPDNLDMNNATRLAQEPYVLENLKSCQVVVAVWLPCALDPAQHASGFREGIDFQLRLYSAATDSFGNFAEVQFDDAQTIELPPTGVAA
jgi:hypothetical protein